MAAAETFLGALLATISAALLGIVSWAWQLSQRVAVVEAHYAQEIATSKRLEEKIERLDSKIDEIYRVLLRRADG